MVRSDNVFVCKDCVSKCAQHCGGIEQQVPAKGCTLLFCTTQQKPGRHKALLKEEQLNTATTETQHVPTGSHITMFFTDMQIISYS